MLDSNCFCFFFLLRFVVLLLTAASVVLTRQLGLALLVSTFFSAVSLLMDS